MNLGICEVLQPWRRQVTGFAEPRLVCEKEPTIEQLRGVASNASSSAKKRNALLQRRMNAMHYWLKRNGERMVKDMVRDHLLMETLDFGIDKVRQTTKLLQDMRRPEHALVDNRKVRNYSLWWAI